VVFASILALGALPLLSARARAGIEAAIISRSAGSGASSGIEIRHRLRRHRRFRAPREEERRQPDEGGKTISKVEEPPPPASKGAPPEIEEAKKPEVYGPPPPPATWTAAEIEAGRKECVRRLSGLHALFERLDPIKDGACGLPSPIRLFGFESEREPEAEFAPAPILSCKMAEALRNWFDRVVQPKAKAHLHATIVHMTTLSGYDCRTRYDDPAQRISQHAYANAVDISEFITAKGERIAVGEAWDAGDERAAFLHAVHDGACEIFGTSLGPDANSAHKSHFHFDMTERRRPLCDFTPAQLRAREQAKKHPVLPPGAVKVPVAGEREPTARPGEKPMPATAVEEPESARRKHLRHRRRISKRSRL
jgi:hypothetical protein